MTMHKSQRHEMVLEKTHSSGVEEWYCPVCGRWTLVNWQPQFKKMILETGDEYITHSGGKGGLRMGTLQITQTDVWEELLEEVDFGNDVEGSDETRT